MTLPDGRVCRTFQTYLTRTISFGKLAPQLYRWGNKAQRGEAVIPSHTANILDDQKTIFTHCQPPFHQPSSAPGTLILLPGTTWFPCCRCPPPSEKPHLPATTGRRRERSACCSSGARVQEGSTLCIVIMCPGSKGQAAHTFYGWATSQNSKQRGRQLALEPSRQQTPGHL